MDYINRGKSVILEFGRYGNALEAYILVANYITRRIHRAYVRRKEAAVGGQGEEPRPLIITIEEAHKFLDPVIAKHTIFGTIAREMRKYNVTLLIVDQRPSGIDPEVMSQVGTRVTALLDEENDIRAVFSGVSGTAALREVLAALGDQTAGADSGARRADAHRGAHARLRGSLRRGRGAGHRCGGCEGCALRKLAEDNLPGS